MALSDEQTNEVPVVGPVDTSPGTPAFGAGTGDAGAPGILSGGQLVRVKRPNQDDLWIMAYEWPQGSGMFVAWQFDDMAQVQAIFGEGWSTTIPWTNKSSKWFNNRVDVVDSADSIQGMSGNFLTLTGDILNEVVSIGGLSDPSVIAGLLNDPEVRAVIVSGVLGGWDDTQTHAALRQTAYWTNVLYPGISTLYGVTANPEQEWLRYTKSVEGSLSILGLARDEDGSWRSTIGRLLNEGIDETEFLNAVPIWQRATTNAVYFDALSKWVKRETKMDMTFDDWFDLISGTAPAELTDIANRAAVQYQAQMTGFDLSRSLIEQIAEQTSMDELGIASAFGNIEQQLLAMGDQGLRKYDLSRSELIQAGMGIQTASGRSMEEVRLKARQAAIEAGLLDDEKAQIFVGYNPAAGTPYRPGLNPLAPERA